MCGSVREGARGCAKVCVCVCIPTITLKSVCVCASVRECAGECVSVFILGAQGNFNYTNSYKL